MHCKLYVVRTVHFGMKLYNDQRNAQVFNLFIYLLLPYMFRAFFKPFFRGKCTTSAVVEVCWVWCRRLGTDTISSSLRWSLHNFTNCQMLFLPTVFNTDVPLHYKLALWSFPKPSHLKERFRTCKQYGLSDPEEIPLFLWIPKICVSLV
jgi:hypothetical protein